MITNKENFLKESNALQKMITLGENITNSLKGKDITEPQLYVSCSLIHLLKLVKSIVILYDNGFYESGMSILRNIYEITFRTIALINDENILSNYIKKFYDQQEKLLTGISNIKAYEYLSKDVLEKSLNLIKQLRSNTKIHSLYSLAQKADLSKEYIEYSILCSYTHFDISILQNVIKEVPDGIYLRTDLTSVDLHQEYGRLICILDTFFESVTNYFNDDNFKKEYCEIKKLCNEIW